ncbi:MAG: UDP-N-acetylglucosamine 2-epimerase (non-hydrolyzing) [Propionibacteriaceae bacterium]|nr:UDP-N-acetylglucosamine 2-epimerase (non-hydrolyzing) [Propionibacteriaceae bacterium]
MARVMVVFGTRPEAIKMAPLVMALANTPGIEPLVTVTGQHREMLDQVNHLFGITPNHDLDVMRPGAGLSELAARVLSGTAAVLAETRPDAVVVQGDTSSAFVGGLAAFYERIPVVHLEAGLRTGNMDAPFPEEGNRRLLSPLARLHLAPTDVSKRNLLVENIDEQMIAVTGNTVIDALQLALTKPTQFDDPQIQAAVDSGRRILLVTAHRRESWGQPMADAMVAVGRIARAHPDLTVVLPMHRNEVVRQVIRGELGELDNVVLTEPLDYHQFCHLMNAAHVVLTDSGGVQEEAPSLGKPVLVMRETTERPEGIAAGTVKLVGTDTEVVFTEVERLLTDEAAYAAFAQAVNPYGDGRAAERSAAAISELLGIGQRIPDFSV